MDCLIALILLFLLSPILIFTCMVVFCVGEGDVFFRQERCGQAGRTFVVLKFATMRRDSASTGSGLFTERNDPRILPLGRSLRASKINELPQLINVLRGDMSMVGWRPLVRSTFERAFALAEQGTYDVKPGITSIASVIGRNEEEEISDIEDKSAHYFDALLPRKVLLDQWWAENISPWNYLVILSLTVYRVLLPSAAIPYKFLDGLEAP